MTPKEISQLLSQRAEEVACQLLPNGKRDGAEWCAGSVKGEAGRSLKVHLTGDKAGVWSDFASGEGGDLLDLWCAVRNVRLFEALKEAKRYLGIAEPQFEAHRPREFARPQRPKCATPRADSPVMRYLETDRKLTAETIAAYRVGEQPGRIVLPYLREDELVFVKYLDLDRKAGKKQIRVEANCEPCLFGWQAIPDNARAVAITEGEIDAMTLCQYGYPALSVPFGGGKGDKQRWVEYEYPHLERFDEIFLCLDRDEEGRAATAELVSRLGRHRCRVVELPHKDANECLQRGVTKAAVDRCFAEARTLDPEELKPAATFVDEVIREFYPPGGWVPGVALPWPHTHDKVRFRPGELSVWTGINGHGKSQLLGHVLLSAMTQGERVCIASLEIKPRRLLMRLTRQAAGLAEPSIPYIRAIHDWYAGRLWLFDLVGTAKADRLLEVFRYARSRYGITQFVIDSFMKCGIAEDDYREQKAFMEALCDFKNEHDSHIHLVAHSRKGENEERPAGKLDVKGTGAITDLADNTFSVWRNKRKEEAIRKAQATGQAPDAETAEKPDTVLICDKQRNGDWEGKILLWWHGESYQFLGRRHDKPKQYVELDQHPGAVRTEEDREVVVL